MFKRCPKSRMTGFEGFHGTPVEDLAIVNGEDQNDISEDDIVIDISLGFFCFFIYLLSFINRFYSLWK